MNPLVQAFRAPFIAGSLVPVVLGAAFAFSMQQGFSLTLFLITCVGVAGLHTGANLLNDYYDARGSDPLNVRITPFSGGSRVLQEGSLTPGTVFNAALMSFALSLGCGIWLASTGRPLVFPLGLLGLAAGWVYSAPPFHLMSRGWGETVIFFAFGPLITLGAHYVMSASLNVNAFVIGIPQGFFIGNVIWINQFPDFEADQRAGKRNLVVRLGTARARYLYCAFMALAFLSVIAMTAAGTISPWAMISLAAFPLALKAMRILWAHHSSFKNVIPAQALTIQTLIAHGILLSVGLILSRILG